MEHCSVCLYLNKVLKYPTHNIAKVIHRLKNYKRGSWNQKQKWNKKPLV